MDIHRQKLAKPVNELNKLYGTQLGKLEEEVKKEGDLDKLVAVQTELKSFANSGPRNVESFPRLTKLQEIYRTELGKRKEAASKQLATLLKSYLTRLGELEKHHTQNNRVEEALKVREEAERTKLAIEQTSAAAPKDSASRPSRSGQVANAEGKLMGAGIGSYADPLAAGTARGYDDFVSVKLWEPKDQKSGWVALRANGSVVTHLDRRASPSKDNIRDFACSENGGIVMVRDDGTLNLDQCSFAPPEDLTDKLTGIVSVSIGSDSGVKGDEAVVAVREDGTMVWWGPGAEKPGVQGPPDDAREGVLKVEGGLGFFHALKQDGSVVVWKFVSGGDGRQNLPADVENQKFTQLAASDNHTLGLTRDGAVVAWGRNDNGQCNVPVDLGQCNKVRVIRNVVSAARRLDGTWVAWGKDYGGVLAKINDGGKYHDVASKLFPPFKYAYVVLIE